MYESTREVESLYLLLKGELLEDEDDFLRSLRPLVEWTPAQRRRYYTVKKRCFPREPPQALTVLNFGDRRPCQAKQTT